jgi:aminoglycoside phosphotransferase (APT) family kinase protein
LLNDIKEYLPVEIPDYRFISLNASFAGYTMLSGSELTSKKYDSLPSKEKRKIIIQLAVFLSALHSIPRAVCEKYNVY